MGGHYFAVGGVRIPCRCRAASVPVYVVFIAGGSSASAFAMLSAGIVCAGLAISMFFGSKEASTGIVALIRRITVWIKNRFIKKEAA